MGGERRGRNVDDLELEPIRILEEHRVVAGAVFRELARGFVERSQPARNHELVAEPVDVLALRDAEGQMVEARPLAVESVARVRRIGTHHPDVGPAPRRKAGHRVGLVDRAVLEVAQQLTVERQGSLPIAPIYLEVVDLSLHQNFSHFTLLRSIPFLTSTSRTLLIVSPPPQ